MKTGIKQSNKYTFNRTEYRKGKSSGTGALDFENLVNILHLQLTSRHIEQRVFRRY